MRHIGTPEEMARFAAAERRAGRTVFRTTVRLRKGRYGARIKTPADAGALKVVIRAAGQRTTRFTAGR